MDEYDGQNGKDHNNQNIEGKMIKLDENME